MTSETPEVQTFQPLGNYTAPSQPTADLMQRLLGRFRHVFASSSTQPFIAEDRLQRSTRDMLDEVAAPPACGPLLDELQATLADWVADPAPPGRLQVMVLPPCDEQGVIEAWARRHAHALLAPPAREDILGAQLGELPLSGEGVLVIARLEDWFLRHRNGLAWIRALLAQLDALERHCVIGCNSWAWAFLCKAAGADLVLPDALTFKPFDAGRLRQWFSALATAETLQGLRFRLSRSGADIMALDEAGEPAHDFFKTLAARSRGIPWVAWHLWRGALRSDVDPQDASGEADAAAAADAQTLWVTALDEFSLPAAPRENALLVLQALLIHGTLSADELALVLPSVDHSSIVSTLLGARLVQRDGHRMRCTPAAYPSIRSGLSTAGLPKGKV